MADYQSKISAGNSSSSTNPQYQSSGGVGDASDGSFTTLNADSQKLNQYTAPKREDFMTGDPDQWESTITLSPDQQRLLDQQTKTSLGLAGLQDSAVGRVSGMLGQPFDTSKIPGNGTMGTVGNVGTYTSDNGAGLASQYDPSKGPLKGTVYDPSNGPRLSKYYDPQSDTNTATQAILSRVNPQLDREEAAMRTRLANQGITQGSEAYNNEINDFGQKRNDAYTQAALQGINLGMAQQGQNFNQSVTGQNQSMAQQAQNFGQQNANVSLDAAQQAQQYAQALQAEQFKQNQQAQMFGQQLQNQNQTFDEQNTNYNNAEQARQRAIQEQAYLRSLPLNELNAIRTGSQVTNPTFTNAPGQTYTAGADYSGAAGNQYNAAIQAANAQNAANGSLMNGLFSLGSAAMGSPGGIAGLFSDRRLKSNIIRIGDRDGYGVYEYDIFNRRERGVMAQEVMWHKPQAVGVHSSGYLMVDYGKL